MAVDKLVDSTQLNSDLTSVANAIRTKGGTSAQLAFPAGFVSAIGDIQAGGGALTEIDSYEFNIPTELSWDDSDGTDVRTITTITPNQVLYDAVDSHSDLTTTDNPFIAGNGCGYFCFVIVPKNMSSIPTPSTGVSYLVRKDCFINMKISSSKISNQGGPFYKVWTKSSLGIISVLATMSKYYASVTNDALTVSTSSGSLVVKCKLAENQKIASGDYKMLVYDITPIIKA